MTMTAWNYRKKKINISSHHDSLEHLPDFRALAIGVLLLAVLRGVVAKKMRILFSVPIYSFHVFFAAVSVC